MTERPKVICLLWEDPTSYTEWTEDEEAEAKKPEVIVSVGLLMHEDDKYVRVALDWSSDSHVNTFGVIPKGCILKRKELALPRGLGRGFVWRKPKRAKKVKVRKEPKVAQD